MSDSRAILPLSPSDSRDFLSGVIHLEFGSTLLSRAGFSYLTDPEMISYMTDSDVVQIALLVRQEFYKAYPNF